MIGLLLVAARASKLTRLMAILVMVVILGAILASPRSWNGYQLAWQAAYQSPPLVATLGAIVIYRARHRIPSVPLRRQQLLVAVSVLAMCSLVQFPFSAPIYFSYIAPLLVLAILAPKRLAL